MRNNLKYIIGILVSSFFGCIITIFVLNYFGLLNKTNIEKVVSDVNITETNTLKSAINKVYDSVVVIQSYNTNGKLISSGTGFYYKKDSSRGYIITNYHVIEKSKKIKVVDTSNIENEATLLGSDEYLDIAVLATEKNDNIKIATLGDSSKIDIGDTVFTVGSPLGIKYMGTVTKGILSGKNRQVSVNLTRGSFIMDVLQTDAAINPGNSGGPLLNINGEVIGVTSLKLVQDEIEGMGFALPIESIINFIDKLENGQKIERPVFGSQFIDVSNKSVIKKYGIEIDDDLTYGTVIVRIEDSSPAFKANLQVGDVIVKINNDKVEDTAHFRYCLYKYNVGDTIEVTYNRNGQENTVKVKLTDKL